MSILRMIPETTKRPSAASIRMSAPMPRSFSATPKPSLTIFDASKEPGFTGIITAPSGSDLAHSRVQVVMANLLCE